MFYVAFRIWRQRISEHFQRFILWRCGEGEVTSIRQHLASGDSFFECIIDCVFRISERFAQSRRSLASLARMRFVNDDCETPPAVFVSDLIEDERKLLDG